VGKSSRCVDHTCQHTKCYNAKSSKVSFCNTHLEQGGIPGTTDEKAAKSKATGDNEFAGFDDADGPNATPSDEAAPPAAAMHGGSTAVRKASIDLSLPEEWGALSTASFPALKDGFSTVVLSYQSNALDTGMGKLFMWAVANGLQAAGISSFNGYMVSGGQNWKKEWFGNLPDCKVVVAMISKSYFKSAACIEEIEEACTLGKPIIPIYLEDVDISGNFCGESFEEKKAANFIRPKISGNRVPPPDQGFFQGESAEDFDRNMATLSALIVEKYGK
jgi:hypothetical protein